jgi:hypothetical protein
MKEHYIGNGKQDQAEELKFSTTSLVQVINRKWKESLDDFTASNTTGIFWHAAKPHNSSGTRQKVTYFFVTAPGQHPKKPQVAQIFGRRIYRTNLYKKLGRESIQPAMKYSRKLLLCHNQLQKRVMLKQI